MSLFKKDPPENAVGIVIPMRDNLKFFKLAFHSVLSFTEYPYMLTIIDNMGTFTTKTYLRSIQKNHPINVIPYQEEFNYAAEVNVGMRYMFSSPSVQYGVALNSDVVVEPHWLSNMIQLINADPKIGIVGPVTNIAIEPQERRKCSMVWRAEHVSGFCMMFKRKVFESLEGFDEQYVGGCYEDQDFCIRATQDGWMSMVCGGVHVHHFWRATRGLDRNVDRNVQNNRDRFMQKFPNVLGTNNKQKEKEPCQSLMT